jgi:hypothetical protein
VRHVAPLLRRLPWPTTAEGLERIRKARRTHERRTAEMERVRAMVRALKVEAKRLVKPLLGLLVLQAIEARHEVHPLTSCLGRAKHRAVFAFQFRNSIGGPSIARRSCHRQYGMCLANRHIRRV